ncbi:hypothetical protein DLAC_11496 [Tieghemostelium lacteum]|uniref:Proteasome assembly chaperone 1 n=1 Tax=Tieghemostelium lacteum TaxID=361077 RepID=A0A152A6I5_TIELA|nr:hypothetical protein DLAC_11496 [Tieghemostelium lacteum]|eukprot:KYR01839.1 hypothetical protein DLAC_11496 [Tieghemostelium lacteum]
MNSFDIQTTRSRNWEIEEEEEESTQYFPLPQPKLNITKKDIDCSNKTLIIATKEAPSIFIRSFFINDKSESELEEIGDITIDDIKIIKTNENILNNRCTIYKLKSNDSVIVILSQVTEPSDRSFNLAKVIIGQFKNTLSILVLDSILDARYLAFDHKHPIPPFVRAIYTSNFENKYSLKPLESPNIVERLTAAIITTSQQLNIPACSVFSLTEPILNLESVQAYESICQDIYPNIFTTPNATLKTSRLEMYKKLTHLVNKQNDKGFYI